MFFLRINHYVKFTDKRNCFKFKISISFAFEVLISVQYCFIFLHQTALKVINDYENL